MICFYYFVCLLRFLYATEFLLGFPTTNVVGEDLQAGFVVLLRQLTSRFTTGRQSYVPICITIKNYSLFISFFIFSSLMAGERALDVSTRQSLVTGLVKTCFPLDVCTFATRIIPSVPLTTSTILARGQWPLGFNSSVMMTMSSTASASVLWVHFFRAVSDEHIPLATVSRNGRQFPD